MRSRFRKKQSINTPTTKKALYILLCAAVATILASCQKTVKTGPDSSRPDVEVTVYAKITQDMGKCVRLHYSVIDFEGNQIDEFVNENYSGEATLSKTFKSGKTGAQLIVSCTAEANSNPDPAALESNAPYELTFSTSAICGGGRDQRSGGDTDSSGLLKLGEVYFGVDPLYVSVAKAVNKVYGSNFKYVITVTEQGFDAGSWETHTS